MDLLKPLFSGKEPEVRRAEMIAPPDWKWRALNALSAVCKYASLAAYIADYLPGRWAAIIFGVASASKDVAFVLADWLDNGKKDNSFKPAE